MSNLKEIKRRIKTIENIEHVTDAIQKIAATRLIKLKNRMLTLRFFSNALLELLYNIVDATFAFKSNPNGYDLLFVITSDKGLCGGFNTRVIETAENYLEKNSNTKLIVSGKKGNNYFEKTKEEILLKFNNVPAFCGLKDIEEATKFVLDNIYQNKVKSVKLIYTEFLSASTLEPSVKQVFPLDFPEKITAKGRGYYIYEPDEEKIISDLFPKFVSSYILLGFEESAAAEHMARMMMMERATKSADDMIIDLTMQRNRNRQAAITKELGEIVGTTSALENA
jgi:F-type H+-transporting ATPase subunit gamma